MDLVADLSDEQLIGPRLAIVNPLLWEIGHVAWFQEKWVRRRRGLPSLRKDADSLYDSTTIPHDSRWDLPLPSRQETLRYLQDVRDRVLDLTERDLTPDDTYFVMLSVFHEDMHAEAFLMTRQLLGYRAPLSQSGRDREYESAGALPGDVVVPGGAFWLGAMTEEPFVFDNEKWAHPVAVRPFAIARAPVTQKEFLSFVNDDGYRRRELWTEAGWRWRESENVERPVYWRCVAPDHWQRRAFDRWLPLELHRPMAHVSWYEAEAYCLWAGRRLPKEAEWELAASDGAAEGRDQPGPPAKRRYPWGHEPPGPQLANLDGGAAGCIDVAALPAGDSPWGCRQMLGNVWEWTASDFLPYPGFVADPYKEYSQPWFGTHKVLRGGSWATRGRLIRNTWRNFYGPERRDPWAGFRTCALET